MPLKKMYSGIIKEAGMVIGYSVIVLSDLPTLFRSLKSLQIKTYTIFSCQLNVIWSKNIIFLILLCSRLLLKYPFGTAK